MGVTKQEVVFDTNLLYKGRAIKVIPRVPSGSPWYALVSISNYDRIGVIRLDSCGDPDEIDIPIDRVVKEQLEIEALTGVLLFIHVVFSYI
jgi:hypothetical protein